MIPEKERITANNFKVLATDSVQSLPKRMFKGIEYVPLAWRDLFQISIWRVDEYGVVKTISRSVLNCVLK